MVHEQILFKFASMHAGIKCCFNHKKKENPPCMLREFCARDWNRICLPAGRPAHPCGRQILSLLRLPTCLPAGRFRHPDYILTQKSFALKVLSPFLTLEIFLFLWPQPLFEILRLVLVEMVCKALLSYSYQTDADQIFFLQNLLVPHKYNSVVNSVKHTHGT